MPGSPALDSAAVVARTLAIRAGTGTVVGDLVVPAHAWGLVLFAHGRGSGRKSPRNQAVAAALEHAGFATLLVDLEGPPAEGAPFDLAACATRFLHVVDWSRRTRGIDHLPLGCFGASTGAAVALAAAAARPHAVQGVVSRGGRLDLAAARLSEVLAPTLLIAGAEDPASRADGQRALPALGGASQLEVVAGDSGSFTAPGTLQRVAHLTANWFASTLGPRRGRFAPHRARAS